LARRGSSTVRRARALARRLSVDSNAASCWLEKAEQEPDESTFTGAVRPRESIHFTEPDLETDVYDRVHTSTQATIRLADTLELNERLAGRWHGPEARYGLGVPAGGMAMPGMG
jgi:hypothetical protein